MTIGAEDYILFVYELIVVFGLVLRLTLVDENTAPESDAVTPQEIDILNPIVEEFVAPDRPAPVTKKDSLQLFEDVLKCYQLNIIYGKKRMVRPKIEVSFKNTGQVLGNYNHYSKRILINILNNSSLRESVDSFIHEYVHHLQIRSMSD